VTRKFGTTRTRIRRPRSSGSQSPDPPVTQLSNRPVAELPLGLAVHTGGKLTTLDQRIPVAAVRGGRDALEPINRTP